MKSTTTADGENDQRVRPLPNTECLFHAEREKRRRDALKRIACVNLFVFEVRGLVRGKTKLRAWEGKMKSNAMFAFLAYVVLHIIDKKKSPFVETKILGFFPFSIIG